MRSGTASFINYITDVGEERGCPEGKLVIGLEESGGLKSNFVNVIYGRSQKKRRV